MTDTTYDAAMDPGTEVVDLPDDLVPTGEELASYLDAPPHIPTPDLARLIGAGDYVWCTWLADVLREAGCHVVEHPGWKTRGRPRSVGPFLPLGLVWHHDASAVGPSPAMAAFIAQIGRPSEGIPAPLSQLWVCMGCNGRHPVGTWHVLAAGRANHAGLGDGWGRIHRDMGNTLSLGVETDNTIGEKTPDAMLTSLARGSAAILRTLDADPMDSLCGHKEYAEGRKLDPDDVNMGLARAAVRELSKPTPSKLVPFPGVKVFDTAKPSKHVLQLERWLLEVYPKSKHEATDLFSRWTRDTVRKFQRAHAQLAGDADGIPGPKTWRLIQLEAARKAGA